MNFGKYCIALMNDELSKFNNSLRNDLEEFVQISESPPHLTLRETFFTSTIEKIILEIKQNSFQFPINIKSIGYSIFDNSYLVLNFNNSPQLQKTHESIMNISQKYIESFKPYKPIGNLTSKQYNLLKKFNNPFSFEYYNPHSTIGKIEEKNNYEIEKILNSKSLKKKFNFTSILIIDKQNKSIYEDILL
jgi:2'-5' RNA ligase